VQFNYSNRDNLYIFGIVNKELLYNFKLMTSFLNFYVIFSKYIDPNILYKNNKQKEINSFHQKNNLTSREKNLVLKKIKYFIINYSLTTIKNKN
jgi:hypothetical protein